MDVNILDSEKTEALNELIEKVVLPDQEGAMFMYVAKSARPNEYQGKFWNFDDIVNPCIGMGDVEFQDIMFGMYAQAAIEFPKKYSGCKTVFGMVYGELMLPGRAYGLGAQVLQMSKFIMLTNVGEYRIAVLGDLQEVYKEKMPLFFFGIEKIFTEDDASYNAGSGKIILELSNAGYDSLQLMVGWAQANIELSDERLVNIQKVLSKRSSE